MTELIDRDVLINLCERGLVPQDRWHDRDSAGAQMQLGKAWVLLQSGCEYWMSSSPEQTADTIWIDIIYKGFDYFEVGTMTIDFFYVPTEARLERAAGKDWY